MSDYRSLIQKWGAFAIISHPDAGKTTLTEKFLPYGGAIVLVGSIKRKKNSRHAVSDWMETEKQRETSATSPILQLQYEGYYIDTLDTSGHQDFSEDTYRTLVAVDSAVMVIDASKGVEAQTRKLFKICLLCDTPIFTFINKMDREARSPFDLLEKIEQEPGIKTYPMNWPIGCGREFKGVCDRDNNRIISFRGDSGKHKVKATVSGLGDPGLRDLIGPHLHEQLCDDTELLDGAGYEFNMDVVCHGRLPLVFSDSAPTNFGMGPFLEEFLRMTNSPLSRKATNGKVGPFGPGFSAFVFKIQTNMNRVHRDRVVFMRVCFDKFEENMGVLHQQEGKKIKLSQPQWIIAQEREIIEEAYAGGIIGVLDPGIFSIDDTLRTPGKKIPFEDIPTFVPEYFTRVRRTDTMKCKQFIEGVLQIVQEGAIQIFQELEGGMEKVIVGVVGVLRFDVPEYRLNHECNTDVRLEPLLYQCIRWISSNAADPKTLIVTSGAKKIQDLKGHHLPLFTNEWNIRWALERNEELELIDFSHG